MPRTILPLESDGGAIPGAERLAVSRKNPSRGIGGRRTERSLLRSGNMLRSAGHAPIHCVILALIAACGREDAPPSNPKAPPGAEKEVETKLLEKGAHALQDLSPVRSLDHYLNGFHVMKDDPSLHMEAHHYCTGMNEEFTQCVIFDGDTADANIIGLEYIVSERLFESLPPGERKYWHPHNYEILSGQLILPGVPAIAEKAALAKKLNSYGKTWHVWDTGHFGHPAASELPVGQPMLAWSYNHDGEAPPNLVERRDARLNVATSEKRKERADLAPAARPQAGVNDLNEKLGTPTGVVAK